MRVRGRVRGDGDLRIEADIEGDVLVKGALELDAGSSVAGAVEASRVTVAGDLTGDVSVSGDVAITATGSVQGNVTAAGLSLEEGGRFIGEIDADFDLPEVIA